MNTSLELLAESLGWTLLHFCWQAAAIALVSWLLDLGLPRARSHARYLVSLAAILSMLAASLVTLGYEMERNQTGNQADRAISSSFAHLAIFGSLPAAAPPVTVGALQATAPRQAGLDLSAVLPWLDVAWLLGVLGLSARTVGGWWWIQRLRRRALAEAPPLVLASLARIREHLGIRWRVDLRISGHIPGPMALGVLRSLILLPASALLALSPEQMEVVLAHELAHVRRADYFWNLIQTMIETLFFFHPAVWWVGARLREQRELCCDDIAIDFCPDPLLYATALLSMEEQRNRKLDLAMALDGQQSRSGLRVRIARMLGEASPSERGRGLAPLPLAAFCAGLAILLLPAVHVFGSFGGGPRAQLQAGTPAPAPVATSATAEPAAPQIAPLPQVSPVAPQPEPHADPEPAQLPSSPQEATDSRALSRVQLNKLHAIQAQVRASITQSRDAMIHAQAAATQVLGAQSAFEIADAKDPSSAQDAPPAAGSDYINQMRAAGYDLPPEKYIDLKILGVTPEYARAMQKLGFGKPSPGELIAMKVQGITPEYVEKLRAAGLEPHSFHEAIRYKIFNLSPEYLAAIKAAGFASWSPQELFQLRVQGVTPEYAAEMRKQFPNVTMAEMIQLRIFRIDDAFIAEAKRHNFAPLTVQTLVRLRISGVLNDGANEPDKK